MTLVTLLVTAKDEIGSFPNVAAWAEGLSGRKLLIDSGSSDGTDDYARERGWDVVKHEYVNASTQLNWALSLVDSDSWVLILDADEVPLFPATEVRELVHRAQSNEYDAVALRRRNYFGSRWIRHGGFYPDWQVRLLRGGLRYEERPVHAHVMVPRKKILFAKRDLHHVTYESVDDYWTKLLRFTRREVQVDSGTSWRPRWRTLRTLYARVPARAPVRFVHRYVLRLGFLDGRLGWHVALWSAVYEDVVSARRTLDVDSPSAAADP